MATTEARAIKIGDVLTIGGDDYRIEEYDALANEYFAIPHGARPDQAGEFLDADKLDLALRRGQVAFAQRQLPLGYMGVGREC